MPFPRRAAVVFVLAAMPLATSSVYAAAAAKPTTRVRAEIPAGYRWDFTPLYADWTTWETSLNELEAKMDAFAALKGTLARGPAALLHAYRALDDVGVRQSRVFRYPQLQRDVDTRNQDVAARFQRIQALFAKFRTATAWFDPELLMIPRATMEQWIKDTPDLGTYAFSIFDTYRQQEHVLDEKGETLLSYATRFNQTPAGIYQELSTSDIKFPEITLSDGTKVTVSPANYAEILNTNYNQADRAQAMQAHLQTYAATAHTYAAIYNALLQRDWAAARSRNYPDTLTDALNNNDIPTAVVETLVNTTRAGTAPLQRYMRLRKKLLGLAEYHLYDTSIPLFKSDARYPYDDAKNVVIASVAPLGADYVAKYRQFVAGGRIDVYENEGKRSGAYCAGVYGVGPYLLMNYNDTLDSIFTLAHEAGHAMHTVLSDETQPFVNSRYTIFVAEVASTTNERFLLNNLLAAATDPKERFILLQHAADSIVRTYFAQVIFADFELQAHRLVEQGKPITADVLNGIYLALLRDYYGEAATIDELYKYTWARIPHFFNSPYYVYQYATCFASSAQIFKELTTGDAAARAATTERYLTLLRSGGNDYPMNQLKKAGVDLTRRETVQAVIDQMDELVTRMEAEAEKIAAN